MSRFVIPSNGFSGLGEGRGIQSSAAPWVGRNLFDGSRNYCWTDRKTTEASRGDPHRVQAFFRPNSMLDARVCGQPGSPPCNSGDSRSGLGALGRQLPAFCNSVRVQLDELEALMSSSAWAALSEATKASATAVYKDINGKVLYVGFLGNDCERDASELKATIQDIRLQMGQEAPSPLRPEQENLPVEGIGSPLVKGLLIAGVAIVGAVAIGYAVRSFR